ncbi:fungal-specific transcription factor domain-containing protein [Ilyonectria sp. MPI-CAGE-AT-0026]|nr:fungal-specific transcription factor domain-containing protein [Ilyonectria sp. MPI-CAGE-AT-0026]
MAGLSETETDSQGPQKSHRVFQACMRCQAKKRRCDGKTPSCTSCMAKGEDCVYGSARRTRGPGRSKQRIQVLEERLSGMESLLRRKEDDVPAGGCLGAAETSPSQQAQPTTSTIGSNPSITASSSGNAIRILVRDDGSPRPANDKRAMLPDPFAFPISERIEDQTAEPKSMRDTRVSIIAHDPTLLLRREDHLLRITADELFDELPLFSPQALLKRLNQPHALNKDADLTWWAAVNALIAKAVQIKTINSSFQGTLSIQWSYFSSAYAVYPELVARGNNLAVVQALLAMVMYTRTSADIRTSLFLLSTAARTAQAIGLHRRKSQIDGSPNSYDEAESRAFWVVYILDSDISLYSGMPPLQPIDDIERELPSSDEMTDVLCASQTWVIFRARAELATIQSRIRAGLYTPKALLQETFQLSRTVVELDLALEDWKSRLPLGISPDNSTARSGQPPLPLPVISLYLAYFNCVSMVHWTLLRRNLSESLGESSSNGFGVELPHLQTTASVAKILAASRATMGLLQELSALPFMESWQLLCYPLSAAIMLLASIIHKLSKSNAQSDIVLLRNFTRFIATMMNQSCCDLDAALTMSQAMEKIGVTAIHETTEAPQQSLPRGRNIQALSNMVMAITHPMYLVQGLMSNLPNRDEDTCHAFATLMNISWEPRSPYGPLVPQCLRPDVQGFTFDSCHSSA